VVSAVAERGRTSDKDGIRSQRAVFWQEQLLLLFIIEVVDRETRLINSTNFLTFLSYKNGSKLAFRNGVRQSG
jgi:hypothetical protein